MNVRELIELLKEYDPDLLVAYQCYSEQLLLEAGQLEVKNLGLPRADGWVSNRRSDKPTTPYLVFPGN